MSSAVISTSAAQSRLFIFDDESAPEVSVDYVRTAALGCPQSSTRTYPAHPQPGIARHDSQGRQSLHEHLQSAIGNQRFPSTSITAASRLAIRPAPEMVSSGITALDILTGGLPRGCITEICGPASSGRTSVLLAALATSTRRGECCALIDASDALDPHTAAAADVKLDHLLWVRCGESVCRRGRIRPPRVPERNEGAPENSPQRHPSASFRAGSGTEKKKFEKISNSPGSKESEHCLEQVLRATDLLLESGGFGLIALDLADVPPDAARRIPLTTWFRFRRAIEHTPTILLVIEAQPIAGSCSSVVLQLGVPGAQYSVPSSNPSHSHLLTGLEITIELMRSRLDRGPVRSAAFETRTAWAG